MTVIKRAFNLQIKIDCKLQKKLYTYKKQLIHIAYMHNHILKNIR